MYLWFTLRVGDVQDLPAAGTPANNTHTHSQTIYDTKRSRAHTQRELIWGDGATRASKDQEALWPPVFKARRRRKRQHLHRCRKCQRRRHRPQ